MGSSTSSNDTNSDDSNQTLSEDQILSDWEKLLNYVSSRIPYLRLRYPLVKKV